jgi:hypothetical protein
MDKEEPQEDGRDGPKDTSTGGTTTKKKHPFVSTHPPQLLGKLKPLENDTLQLSIPFTKSDEDDTQTNHDQPSQLIFQGKHIVTQGKFFTLSFKRTGGNDGSITCKDVFQSVLVLGERQWKNNDHHPPSENEDTKEGVVVMHHYGGSNRTVDGGGCVGSGVGFSKKSRRKEECHSESNSDVHSVEDVSEAYSEDEFVPQMAKKNTTKRSKGDDEEKPILSHPKRTSRRSASKALKVSYADEESDVDLGDDSSSDSEENSHDESQRTDDDECLDTKAKKKPRYALQPMSKKNQVSSVLDADAIQFNKPSTPKKSCSTTKQGVKKAVSTSLNSPISPRRRKKASPQKSPSPSKRNIMDLSDDSFTFL